MKTRDEKDHGDYEKRDTKDGCVGYGVVNREALDSLNRMSGKGSGHSTLSDYMGMSGDTILINFCCVSNSKCCDD